MEILTELWRIIVDAVTAYMQTVLPADTLTGLVDILEYSSNTVIALAREYITVIFG